MQQRIASWNELATLLEQHMDGNWLYRGEGRQHGSIQPKAGRVSSSKGSARKMPYNIEDEREALRIFKREARPHLGHRPETDLEWLAIAQHHGMSTRLLDWSESLLVAAYFAVANAGVSGDAFIYAVRDIPHVTPAQEKDPFGIKSVRLYRPPHITPRIPAQRSVFTYHPEPDKSFSPKGMLEICIDGTTCSRIKNILNKCAINESSLFPDVDGLSRYIGWRYKWGKLKSDVESS